MDLKKILALAMMALLALPSLTMVVGADPTDDPINEDGAGLAGAIERAREYLYNVRTSAEDLAEEYSGNEMIQGYLNEICYLLDQDGEEAPEFLLEAGTYGIAEWSDVKSHLGTYSVHLETTGDLPTAPDWLAAEARIVIPMPVGFTLGELDTISWWTFLESGYLPHVDIFTEVETLVAEGAHVNNNLVTGWATGTWINTFDGATGVYTPGRGITGSTSLLTTVNSETAVWFSSGSAAILHTLGEFQTPTLVAGMNESTVVTKLEIEIDNWVVQSEAYVDDIKIDGVTYDFEEEPEDLGAEGFLDQASAYLEGGEVNLAARSLASARNILGRVKGLLTSMIKIDKVARTDWFIQQFEHRITGLEDKIHRLRGRFGEGKTNKAKTSMGLAKGKLGQLGEDLSEDNVDETLDGLDDIIENIDATIEELEGDTSNILEAIDRLEAKIRRLMASSEKRAKKGSDTSDVDEALNSLETLLNEIINSLEGGDTETAENLLEQAEDLVSEAGSNIRGSNKGHKNKGSKGKSKGKGR